MSAETLVLGYVVRVAVHRNRWRITVLNLATREITVLPSFAALHDHLERSSLHPRPPPAGRGEPAIDPRPPTSQKEDGSTP